jgi:hypothetical protein
MRVTTVLGKSERRVRNAESAKLMADGQVKNTEVFRLSTFDCRL